MNVRNIQLLLQVVVGVQQADECVLHQQDSFEPGLDILLRGSFDFLFDEDFLLHILLTLFLVFFLKVFNFQLLLCGEVHLDLVIGGEASQGSRRRQCFVEFVLRGGCRSRMEIVQVSQWGYAARFEEHHFIC